MYFIRNKKYENVRKGTFKKREWRMRERERKVRVKIHQSDMPPQHETGGN